MGVRQRRSRAFLFDFRQRAERFPAGSWPLRVVLPILPSASSPAGCHAATAWETRVGKPGSEYGFAASALGIDPRSAPAGQRNCTLTPVSVVKHVSWMGLQIAVLLTTRGMSLRGQLVANIMQDGAQPFASGIRIQARMPE